MFFSQVNAVLPSEAQSFYENTFMQLKPAIKSLIEKNANKLTGHKINIDSLSNELRKNPLLRGRNENELEAITVLILVQASKNADNNLKQFVIHKKRPGPEPESEEEIEKNKNYASSMVENKSEIALLVSIIMKKLSGAQEMVMDKFK
jgi:hypothetical protein